MKKTAIFKKRINSHTQIYFSIFLASLMFFFLSSCNPEPNPSPTSKNMNPQLKNLPSTLPIPNTLETKTILYLMGKYNPSDYLISFYNPGETQRVHYLLPEVLEQYKKMSLAFQEEMALTHPKWRQPFFIVSSFRSFNQQKAIWEEKFHGKRPMREFVHGKKSEEIVSLILEFSSAPGTSRHHWGTDLDLNSLENNYFEKGGKGEIIYQWLLQNAYQFGFCQPYNPIHLRDNKGYQEEKWHWSYFPISSQLQKLWVEAYQKGAIQITGFSGSEHVHPKALEYVNSINPECLNR